MKPTKKENEKKQITYRIAEIEKKKNQSYSVCCLTQKNKFTLYLYCYVNPETEFQYSIIFSTFVSTIQRIYSFVYTSIEF